MYRMAIKRSADWARNFVTMNYDQARIVGVWAWSFLDKNGRVRSATFDSSDFIVNSGLPKLSETHRKLFGELTDALCHYTKELLAPKKLSEDEGDGDKEDTHAPKDDPKTPVFADDGEVILPARDSSGKLIVQNGQRQAYLHTFLTETYGTYSSLHSNKDVVADHYRSASLWPCAWYPTRRVGPLGGHCPPARTVLSARHDSFRRRVQRAPPHEAVVRRAALG